MEEGETREEALRREVMGETGVKNIITRMEDLCFFEFSDPKPNQEYVYGMEISPSGKIVLGRKEHGEYRRCSFQEALRLLHWKENRKALRKLNVILTQH
jgi:8-oxo-dGTP pyrophosphatase MutT (NUDIX family)